MKSKPKIKFSYLRNVYETTMGGAVLFVDETLTQAFVSAWLCWKYQ